MTLASVCHQLLGLKRSPTAWEERRKDHSRGVKLGHRKQCEKPKQNINAASLRGGTKRQTSQIFLKLLLYFPDLSLKYKTPKNNVFIASLLENAVFNNKNLHVNPKPTSFIITVFMYSHF